MTVLNVYVLGKTTHQQRNITKDASQQKMIPYQLCQWYETHTSCLLSLTFSSGRNMIMVPVFMTLFSVPVWNINHLSMPKEIRHCCGSFHLLSWEHFASCWKCFIWTEYSLLYLACLQRAYMWGQETRFTQHQRSIEALALPHGNHMQLVWIVVTRSASLQYFSMSFSPCRKPGMKSRGHRSTDTTCSVWRWSEGFSSCLELMRRSCECFRRLVILWRTLPTSPGPQEKSCWRLVWVPNYINT